jgi:hypothetical protein
VTAWSAKPARGQFRYCDICGARLAFVPAGRAGDAPEVQARLFELTQAHLQSKGCNRAGTFSGGVIFACRCARPLRISRKEGLMCARCEGLVAPECAPPPVATPATSDPSAGGSA